MTTDSPSVPSLDRAALRDLLAPARLAIAGACALQVVASIAGVVPFVAVAELARALAQPVVDGDRVWAVAVAGVAALLVRLVFLGLAACVTHFADNDLQLDIRRRMAAHLGRVPLGWFDEHNSGAVKKALQDDVDALHHLVAHSYLELTAAIVVPLASVAYLLTIDWRLTLVTLVPALLGVGLYFTIMRNYGAQMAAYGAAIARVNSASVEFVQGIAVVKTFGQSGRAHRRFLAEAAGFVEFFWQWVKGLLVPSTLAELVLSPLVALLAVLAAGALFVANGWLAPLDVLPFALLGLGITAPFMALNYAQQDLSMAQQAAGRIAALLAAPVLPVAGPGGPVPADDTVRFHGVRFSYDGATEVLRGVDLVLAPGTVTALVGPSGSGKSTLAKLVPRFWDPSAGVVSLGGVDLRELPPDELYKRVGFVFQDVRLLRASVRDNIRLGDPTASDARVEAAARAAQIHERLAALPRGYDSVVGEDAVLSGGEAQRVTIARALLADPRIVVLDEATAFADPESEAAIQDALATLAAGRTLLVVAHRLHTIVGADQIVVVDGGAIVERGRHAELLAADGRYRRLWDAASSAADLAPEVKS
ncbi:ABC transporter ATP-binding protein [Nannocystis exedens]|uniref:ABC transporter ATP-binding protein n=1 Tax=Nannocystis exedens TaxID=54 RepID=UPI000BC52B9D|nr:ABC transporter ATP-binding protein [Nannocystis exedens]PCC68581.1 ABC transporter ATP-binding protein [Nannocystis exedens]